MSTLTLVRHGQASFFADDYDRLSPLGEQQALELGRYWVRNNVLFDDVYAGPRSRQRRTAELVGSAYQAAGLHWPEPIVLPDLDEYDLHGLIHHFAPQLAERNAEFARLAEAYQNTKIPEDRLWSFQRMFERLLKHWQELETEHDQLESWSDFRRRVARLAERVQGESGRGRRVAAFTSGGFISGMAQRALGVSDAKTLELNWRIRNSSLTEFLYTNNRFSLDSFNTVPHLDDPALWTYR